MATERSTRNSVPITIVAGLIVIVAMAMAAPLRPFVIFVAVPVIAFALYQFMARLADAEERIKALKVAEQTVIVRSEDVSASLSGKLISNLGFPDVLRAIPDPILIVSGYEPHDIAGRWILFANTAAQTTFRIEEEGGLLVSSIRNPEVLECVDEALFGQINRSATFETNGGARDQYWQAFASPLPVAHAHYRLALLVIRDETDTRRMERMRADFLANASHELRTPLASLTGFIETLRGHAKEDEKVREKFLDIMAAQADRMGRLIHDLLSLSRIELNEHVPPSGEADLLQAVRDVVDGLTLIAKQKGVRIRINGDFAKGIIKNVTAWPVIGDRDQILQVMQNLIDNALKYAPCDSDVTVDIRFDLTHEQAVAATEANAAKLVLLRPDRNVHEHYARVTVRDSGPGIRREFLPRLAERFYRVEGQKSGDRLGTGLGLAIVKHIINRHRGGLMVESQGQVSSSVDDILERDAPEVVTPAPVATFTAFSAYFPQARALG